MDASDILKSAGIDIDDTEGLAQLWRYTFSLAVVTRAEQLGLDFDPGDGLAFARAFFDELTEIDAAGTVDFTMINAAVEKFAELLAEGPLPSSRQILRLVEPDDEEADADEPIGTYRRNNVADCLSVGEAHQCEGLLPQMWLPRRGDYVGYFLNQHHEDLVFVARRRKRDAILLHSDLGWEPVRVVAGRVPNVVLDPDEQMFIELCWRTASSPMFDIVDPVDDSD